MGWTLSINTVQPFIRRSALILQDLPSLESYFIALALDCQNPCKLRRHTEALSSSLLRGSLDTFDVMEDKQVEFMVVFLGMMSPEKGAEGGG